MRIERVASDIQHAICQIIQRDLKDPRVGFVTVTSIQVSPDLRHAKVYFSCLAQEGAQETASCQALKSASGFIRSQLSRCLRMRYVPELDFRLDETIECEHKIDSLFKKLNIEKDQAGQEG